MTPLYILYSLLTIFISSGIHLVNNITLCSDLCSFCYLSYLQFSTTLSSFSRREVLSKTFLILKSIHNFEFQTSLYFTQILIGHKCRCRILSFYPDGLSCYQVTWLSELDISHCMLILTCRHSLPWPKWTSSVNYDRELDSAWWHGALAAKQAAVINSCRVLHCSVACPASEKAINLSHALVAVLCRNTNF